MKKSYTLNSTINKDIKVGDTVLFIDGSTLTNKEDDELASWEEAEDIYIVYSYPNITKIHRVLKEIPMTVLEVDIKDKLVVICKTLMYQDIIVGNDDFQFRTNSYHVRKIDKSIIL